MAGTAKYGMMWDASYTSLDIEMECIRMGGLKEGRIFHYEQMRRILWPQFHQRPGDDHRWHRLCRDTILDPKSKVTVLAGCASSGKTHEAAWIFLCEYMCFPEETCVLISSTTIPALRMRVWGEITKLWQEAKDEYPELPGHLLDGRIAITTDALEDGDYEERRVRDMRKGLFGIPCVSGGKFVGLSKYMGIKQRRMRLIADEASAMEPGFLSAFSNLNANPDFRAVICGNFNDIMDCLGIAAEPIDGWGAHLEPTKTSVWDTKFYSGKCVNMIGTDSPNNDFPEQNPPHFPYLISRQSIAETLTAFDKDSMEYYSMCVGSMKIAMLQRRFLTREMVAKHRANQAVIWDGSGTSIKVYAIDASYGGDRCVGGSAEFGKEVGGKIVLSYGQPHIIPIRVDSGMSAEDQIATYAMNYCTEHGIPPENVFHDSTGRGSLGTAFARIWSSKPNPVEFGGRATERPVPNEFLYDPETGAMRAKLWREHVDRFVTELWWAIRIATEAEQIRSLPEEAISELCMREWNKKEKQPIAAETKEEMKKRSRRSPDFGDWSVIILEGARRLGFAIDKLRNHVEESEDEEWLDKEMASYRKFVRKHELSYR